MISKKSKAGLLKLIEFMETLPKSANKHFHMSMYVRHEGDHAHGIPKKPADLMTCGTTACAMGWMATMPYFKRKGLTFAVLGGEPWPHIKDEPFDYTDIAQIFFGVDRFKADALFSGANEDKTPKAWAKRVRGLMRQWERTQA